MKFLFIIGNTLVAFLLLVLSIFIILILPRKKQAKQKTRRTT